MHALYSVFSRFLERETVAIRIGLAPRAIGLGTCWEFGDLRHRSQVAPDGSRWADPAPTARGDKSCKLLADSIAFAIGRAVGTAFKLAHDRPIPAPSRLGVDRYYQNQCREF